MCPSAEDLCRYLNDELDEADRAAIAAHLEDCQQCLEAAMNNNDAEIADGLRRLIPPRPAPIEAAFRDAPPSADLSNDDRSARTAGDRVRYFGNYELIQELGGGGMGIVYKARQIKLDRRVALKMIRPALLASDDARRRFENEAKAIAQLDNHAHIVPIYEVGQHQGRHYFSMKLVDGGSLAQRVDDFHNDPRASAMLVAKVARAVDYAHQRALLHRDLKPANILLDDRGEPCVTDFGLAKRLFDDSELTLSGVIVGTPAYMAPEQASGRRGAVTTLSDVYGLGATLYALLTGHAPFGGDSVEETLEQVRKSEPSPPSKINPRTPRDLETICLKAMAKEPVSRYSTAGELAADLGRFLNGEAIQAAPVSAFERAWRWCRRRPVIAGLTTAVVVAVLGGLIGTSLGWLATLEAQAKEKEQTKLAEQQTELAEQRLYDTRMNLVQRYWEDYHGALLKQALDEYLPVNQGGVDRRDIEYYYWERKFSSGHITLKGHIDGVSSVAFSSDGRRLAYGSRRDRTVKVLDAATGQETLILEGHTGVVLSVAFSPDGKRLASASSDGTVKVWDAATGQGTLILKETSMVSSVAFSPDGKRLASASDGNTVKVMDAATGQETLTLKGHHTDPVMSVAFSPDGRRLASADLDGTARVWDAATGQETLTLKGHTKGVWSVAFSPDGEWLASASRDGTVRVWHTRTGQETRILKGHTGWVHSVAFSPDGKWLASASFDNTVKVWDFTIGQETRTLKGHTGAVWSVAFSPDGRQLASASFDNTVKVWDFTIGQETRTLKWHTGAVWSVAFSPDGRQLASASKDYTMRVWDAGTGQETLELEEHIDTETHTLKLYKGPINTVWSVTFSPDGRWLASAGCLDDTVKVWDAATGKEIRTLKGHTDHVVSVLFSPDGRRLASASDDHTVKVWDVATGKETRTFKGHTSAVTSVAFSPDGRRLASASDDHTVKVWDAATGKEIRTLKGHTSVAFSPDGQRLASASDNYTVKVWDAATGKETRTLKGHTNSIRGVAFSPNGQRLASASEDQTVKVWDARTGQETLTLKEHTDSVFSVAFSPDGRRLASASGDGTVKIWDARPLDAKPTESAPTPR